MVYDKLIQPLVLAFCLWSDQPELMAFLWYELHGFIFLVLWFVLHFSYNPFPVTTRGPDLLSGAYLNKLSV